MEYVLVTYTNNVIIIPVLWFWFIQLKTYGKLKGTIIGFIST
jgi:hypothetical protein